MTIFDKKADHLFTSSDCKRSNLFNPRSQPVSLQPLPFRFKELCFFQFGQLVEVKGLNDQSIKVMVTCSALNAPTTSSLIQPINRLVNRLTWFSD